MPTTASPFVTLFNAYADATDGIGTHLTRLVARQIADAPLVVIYATGIVIFTGGTRASTPIRQANPGFLELAGISHLGPAIGSLAAAAQAGATTWSDDAQRLARNIAAAQAANTIDYWRGLGVAVWTPNLDAIRKMVAYACALSLDFIARFQRDPQARTFDVLVRDFLETRSAAFPVPFDHVMIATFCLTGLTGTCSALAFLRQQAVDWRRAFVVLAGGNGGPAAALTRCTNHFVQLLDYVSDGELDAGRTFLIPMSVNPDDATLDTTLRTQVATLYGRAQLAGKLFPAYPRFVPAGCPESVVAPATSVVHVPPRAASADDLFAFVARLRFMMEDPTQLLSSTVATYVLDQLRAGRAPEAIDIPGLAAFRVASA
ncbi:MAG TPA: DUF5624 domain-containing protein [Tahibacter sp.]|uniref:DUF5624 domain-containing protein n=1 Tax=Tahibacter sp. TaxID=2056211 RepID=UPI002CBC514B|nr:DUF5624 domain-containing protein [Tahibacter sp.]HSX59843.1 DUF5624 domain-containing protein [Tahibacter sp.]